MDIERFRLDDPLLVAADWENADDIARHVADAATEKALREVVQWLRKLGDSLPMAPLEIVHLARADGFKLAANELEAMLAG